MVIIIIVVVVVILGAGTLIYIGLQNPQSIDEKTLMARLDELTQTGEQIDLEKIELSQPFTQRVIYPIARNFGNFAVRFTPQNALQSISRKLDMAGNPGRIDPTIFLAMQFLCMLFFSGIIILVFIVGQTNWPLGRVIIFSLAFGVLGFYFPQLWLSGKINKRQREIRKQMPDALDLLTICVEAGLGFDGAMAKVSEKWETELSFAFTRVMREIQLGKLRRDALRDMADNLGVSEMSSFVAAVIQSEQLGVSLAKVLRIQSDQMRIKRRQLAEEMAHRAPIKMLIPMALLIFPALIIVLLTPAAIRIFRSSLGQMFGGVGL